MLKTFFSHDLTSYIRKSLIKFIQHTSVDLTSTTNAHVEDEINPKNEEDKIETVNHTAESFVFSNFT